MSLPPPTKHGTPPVKSRVNGGGPEAEPEHQAVLEQMERMLANPLFKHSKRYSSFFRFVVEESLKGRADRLKERTLGMRVFGRDPDYDTNLDPVVRITAGEIRKRIAQYYHEPGKASELRIDLAPGSYVPTFRAPGNESAAVAIAPRPPWRPGHLVTRGLLAPVLRLLAALKTLAPQSALDKFWSPILKSPSPVLLVVGQPVRSSVPSEGGWMDDTGAEQEGPEREITLRDMHWMGRFNMALSDAFALARLAGLFHAKGKKYELRGEAFTSFADLRSGPVVLIGAFNNDWTMHLTSRLHFTFDIDTKSGIAGIKDDQNPTQMKWTVNVYWPYLRLREDYAVISRVHDPTTGQMIVAVGGIMNFGTAAAGELLSSPALMDSIAQMAPRGWERKNIQIVIATTVISGDSGPPRVIATHFW